jgi:membrane-associated phospholipid phosphatase
MRHADDRWEPTVVTAQHVPRSHGAFGQVARQIARQGALVAAAVGLYFGVRGMTEADPGPALRNAGHLMAVEEALHISWERTLQQAVGAESPAATVFNWIYIYGHWPVIVVSLTWLALCHPAVFARARDAILVSGGVGLVLFMTVPVAPPRLADPALVDTITQQSNAYRVLQPAAFTNQYAALPSLHVGWNLIVSLAAVAAVTRVWTRVLAVTAALSMDVAVVVTANHYVADVAAGAALSAGAWLLVDRLARRRRRAGRVDGPPGRGC